MREEDGQVFHLSQAFANGDDPRVVFREDDDRLEVLNGAENFAAVAFRLEHAQTPPGQTQS
jgi:hypothetical protein